MTWLTDQLQSIANFVWTGTMGAKAIPQSFYGLSADQQKDAGLNEGYHAIVLVSLVLWINGSL